MSPLDVKLVLPEAVARDLWAKLDAEFGAANGSTVDAKSVEISIVWDRPPPEAPHPYAADFERVLDAVRSVREAQPSRGFLRQLFSWLDRVRAGPVRKASWTAEGIESLKRAISGRQA